MSGSRSDPGATAHKRHDEVRVTSASPASVLVIFLLFSSVLIVLYKCKVDDKWVPLHIRSWR